MRHLLREPLVHFLLGGGALFLLYGAVAEETSTRRSVVVDEQQVSLLAATFERTWLRPPTPSELEGLVQDFVDEEILYREARELGLDRDDLVVRRRLRQKMEFLHLDLVEPSPPTDAELAAFLDSHAELFREPARRTFRQLYLDPDAGEGDPQQRAEQLLARLRADAPAEEVHGDPTLLPDTMHEASEREVAATFGPGFAADLFAQSGEEWQGPVASSFGLHAVRIERRTPERRPPLAEVRQRVERELAAERREQAQQRFLELLRARYDVEVRLPDTAPALSKR